MWSRLASQWLLELMTEGDMRLEQDMLKTWLGMVEQHRTCMSQTSNAPCDCHAARCSAIAPLLTTRHVQYRVLFDLLPGALLGLAALG